MKLVVKKLGKAANTPLYEDPQKVYRMQTIKKNKWISNYLCTNINLLFNSIFHEVLKYMFVG